MNTVHQFAETSNPITREIETYLEAKSTNIESLADYPAVANIGVNPGGWEFVTLQILKWGSCRGLESWRVWFQVFYAVKGRDRNPGPPSFQTRLTPLFAKAFVKANSILPSSAAVEHLFSSAGMMLSPRRCKMTDRAKLFDTVVFLTCRPAYVSSA
jgi:hypothetical protein